MVLNFGKASQIRRQVSTRSGALSIVYWFVEAQLRRPQSAIADTDLMPTVLLYRLLARLISAVISGSIYVETGSFALPRSTQRRKARRIIACDVGRRTGAREADFRWPTTVAISSSALCNGGRLRADSRSV